MRLSQPTNATKLESDTPQHKAVALLKKVQRASAKRPSVLERTMSASAMTLDRNGVDTGVVWSSVIAEPISSATGNVPNPPVAEQVPSPSVAEQVPSPPAAEQVPNAPVTETTRKTRQQRNLDLWREIDREVTVEPRPCKSSGPWSDHCRKIWQSEVPLQLGNIKTPRGLNDLTDVKMVYMGTACLQCYDQQTPWLCDHLDRPFMRFYSADTLSTIKNTPL